jgi:hypothetical protein
MSTTETYTRTEADPRDFPVRLTDAFEDGDVIGNKWEVNRWEKYGKDRLYFSDHDGYIDVESGAVKENAPVTKVEVEEKRDGMWVCYYVEKTDIDHTTEKFVAAIKR